MRHTLRSRAHTCMALALALAFVGIAAVASAAEVCIDLDNADGHVGLYRLTVTSFGSTTASLVGTGVQGATTQVVTAAGALVGGDFELTVQGTDIVPHQGSGLTLLVKHDAHIHLAGPGFTSGTFEAARVLLFPEGQQTTLTEGTASVIACPPQG
jgi:hypothetical protein